MFVFFGSKEEYLEKSSIPRNYGKVNLYRNAKPSCDFLTSLVLYFKVKIVFKLDTTLKPYVDFTYTLFRNDWPDFAEYLNG